MTGITEPRAGDQALEAVIAVAESAGREALRYFQGALAVERKADGSPVTDADRAAERVARTWIETHFPADGIHGEEQGAVRPDARRQWLIDPVDGTRTFVRGVPLWATLVALCENGVVIAGAAVFPALGEQVAAARGAGCWWNGTRCRVSGVSRLGDALVLTTDDRFAAAPHRRAAWERLATEAALARTWGDAYGHLLVATGRAEAMLDPIMQPWDAAPFEPIVTEAGGVFTAWDGGPGVFGGSSVSTNSALAVAVRGTIAPRPEDAR